MGEEIKEELIGVFEDVWRVFFARIKKNKVSTARSKWVDEVDLFLPQIRALCLMRRYGGFPGIIYGSSYRGVKKIAHRLARKYADMVPDLLDNFISLNDTEAPKQLSEVTELIFREIMKINKEGLLSVEKVYTDPPDHIKITLKLEECAECFGVKETNKHSICFYHAGTLTGIVSSLLNKKLYGYETECCAAGEDECVFIIEDNNKEHKKYLKPGKIDFSLHKRLEDTLESKNPRPIGNETDLRYYQLVVLNSLIENPERFSKSSYKAGIEYGKELASFLQTYYKKKEEELFDVISRYYRDLKHLQIELKGSDEIRVKQVAEISGISGLSKEEFFLGFLFGELEGLLSVICKEKTFENDDLVITFKKQE